MSIEVDLKKEGIEVIKPLDSLITNSIAQSVSEKLVAQFPEQNLNYDDLFAKISRLNMYIAKMPVGLSYAKYYYKNCSIYFCENIDFDDLEPYAIHECIHYLQELKDVKGNLIQLGLCDFGTSNFRGMALNEAAVQLMSSIALDIPKDNVKYYDITIPTNSPSYYTLECNLLEQMAYITGSYSLFNSTLYSNNSFKSKFISLTSAKTYENIEKNMDKLLSLEDNLSSVMSNIRTADSNVDKLNEQAKKLRSSIKQTYFRIQKTIITSYFNLNFNNITTLEQIENYRRKLYNYKDLVGTTDNYTFFNDYYVSKMADLEEKYNKIEASVMDNTQNNLALVPVKDNFITRLFKKVRLLFSKNKYTNNEEEF